MENTTDSTKGRKKKETGRDFPFAVRLRQLLKETKTTQPTIAEAIGVSRQAIGQWKEGNTVPDIVDFIKVADYFGVSLDYLAGKTEVKAPAKESERQIIQAMSEALSIMEKQIIKMHSDEQESKKEGE